ncbi:hypothetical protein LIER_43439 [Lithospermum erythrorhizon]|uniref:Uncharacterized protein n=1 Tax=Lithospermum erythrorhizon TaxID=34254 RepID=A0AAV3Q4H0_LITER
MVQTSMAKARPDINSQIPIRERNILYQQLRRQRMSSSERSLLIQSATQVQRITLRKMNPAQGEVSNMCKGSASIREQRQQIHLERWF